MKLESDAITVHVVPMKRRHVRAVLRIEEQVYPRPWTHSLFLSEIALRTTRAYYVATIPKGRGGREVVGYAGLMMSAEDGHVTTIAVDPAWQRHRVATRLMLALAREALVRQAQNLTLEVRLSNLAAQHLYRRFGFAPVGVRKNYYQDGHAPGSVPGGEDALVMWVHEIDTADYGALLSSIERALPGTTRFD